VSIPYELNPGAVWQAFTQLEARVRKLEARLAEEDAESEQPRRITQVSTDGRPPFNHGACCAEGDE